MPGTTRRHDPAQDLKCFKALSVIWSSLWADRSWTTRDDAQKALLREYVKQRGWVANSPAPKINLRASVSGGV